MVARMSNAKPQRFGEITISGRGPVRVVIVGESGFRYTIKAVPGSRFKLIGGSETISGDMTAQVPKRALKLL